MTMMTTTTTKEVDYRAVIAEFDPGNDRLN